LSWLVELALASEVGPEDIEEALAGGRAGVDRLLGRS
jgi:hypothetical protein